MKRYRVELICDEGFVAQTLLAFADKVFDKFELDEYDFAHGTGIIEEYGEEGELRFATEDEDSEIYLIDDVKTAGREVYAEATFHDGYAEGFGFRLEYPKLSELTPELIHNIDLYCGGRCYDSGCITPNDVFLYMGVLTQFGIMDTTSGHNPDLVRDINIRWVEDHEMFRPILCALYERDIDEITDKDTFKIDSWISTPQYKKGEKSGDWSEYNKLIVEIMRTGWQEFAYDYLMGVADDQDLSAILEFVRYDKSDH